MHRLLYLYFFGTNFFPGLYFFAMAFFSGEKFSRTVQPNFSLYNECVHNVVKVWKSREFYWINRNRYNDLQPTSHQLQ